MKNLLLLFFIVCTPILYSQTVEEIDAAAAETCTYLETLDYIESDEIKLDILYRNNFSAFLEKLPEEKIEEAERKLYYRLQRNCVAFQQLLQKLEPHVDDAKIVAEKPKITISKKELKAFKKTEDFSYFEASGERTMVKIKDGYWQDHFTDNTYSKLFFKWIGTYDFELEFIESDNETRSNMSIPGDTYQYSIIEKKEGFYIISVTMEGQDMYQIFKMYYE